MTRDPSLLQLARAGSAWAKAGFVVLLAGVVVVVATATVLRPGKPKGGAVTLRVDGDPAFRIQYARGELRIARQTPDVITFRDAGDDHQLSALFVTRLQLRPYAGSPTGALPLASERAQRTIEGRFDEGSVRFVDEGFVPVAENPRYQMTYVARRDGSQWFGRAVIVLPDVDGARGALLLDGQEQPGRQISSPRLVGREGDLRIPMRSITFVGG